MRISNSAIRFIVVILVALVLLAFMKKHYYVKKHPVAVAELSGNINQGVSLDIQQLSGSKLIFNNISGKNLPVKFNPDKLNKCRIEARAEENRGRLFLIGRLRCPKNIPEGQLEKGLLYTMPINIGFTKNGNTPFKLDHPISIMTHYKKSLLDHLEDFYAFFSPVGKINIYERVTISKGTKIHFSIDNAAFNKIYNHN